MLDIKIILNIYYKPSNFIKNLIANDIIGLYYPINGGASLKYYANNYDWLNFDDNKENNISIHNSLLNEMTSIYWFWKNYDMSNLKYVGFNHYRRLFNPEDFQDYHDYDIIVMNKIPFLSDITVTLQYQYCHFGEDINKLSSIFEDEYGLSNDFLNYNNHNYLYAPCNMFIMKKELFEEYCKFIFDILFELERKITIRNGSKYQNRAIAFLSERITSFWMYLKSQLNFKIKEIPIEFIKET